MSDDVSDSLRDLWYYVRAVARHWKGWVTGSLLTAVLYFYPYVTRAQNKTLPGWAAGGIFLWFGVLVSGFRAWKDERKRILALQGRLAAVERELQTAQLDWDRRLAEVQRGFDRRSEELGRDVERRYEELRRDITERGPRLSLRYDASDPLCWVNEGGGWWLRLQVLNEGDQMAVGVRVVLDKVWPEHAAKRMEPFPLMGSKTYSFSIAPARKRPSAYVDVLYQQTHASFGYTRMLLVEKDRKWMQQDISELRLTLRVEATVDVDPYDLSLSLDDQRRFQLTSIVPAANV